MKSYSSNRPFPSRTFTLIEVLVVIAILGTAGIALSSMIQFFYRGNAFLFEQTAALDSARRGMREAVVSIREASYGDDGSYPITEASDSLLTIYSDFDDDASVERVRYSLSETVLYREVTNSGGSPPSYAGQPSSTTTIATYVQSTSTPLFTYYDVAGTELSSPIDISGIAAIGITLTTDLNPLRAPNLFTLTGRATLRNLRDEVE